MFRKRFKEEIICFFTSSSQVRFRDFCFIFLFRVRLSLAGTWFQVEFQVIQGRLVGRIGFGVFISCVWVVGVRLVYKYRVREQSSRVRLFFGIKKVRIKRKLVCNFFVEQRRGESIREVFLFLVFKSSLSNYQIRRYFNQKIQVRILGEKRF